MYSIEIERKNPSTDKELPLCSLQQWYPPKILPQSQLRRCSGVSSCAETALRVPKRPTRPTLNTSWISKASARQRAGRAGRTASGCLGTPTVSGPQRKMFKAKRGPEDRHGQVHRVQCFVYFILFLFFVSAGDIQAETDIVRSVLVHRDSDTDKTRRSHGETCS